MKYPAKSKPDEAVFLSGKTEIPQIFGPSTEWTNYEDIIENA